MGQPVAVVEKRSPTPGMVRFEANRSLTGMGHEHFASREEAVGTTPAAELARRLFDTGRVHGVHVFSNIVTVDLLKGYNSDGLAEIVEKLYIYYRPGVVPPTMEELMGGSEEPASGGGGGGGEAAADGGGGGVAVALSEAAKRVPAHLLERSRAALERWKANH
jgi:hypothetical protein